MKILLVHPGADMSTKDVWSGLRLGLVNLGHEIADYALDVRIARAGQWLEYCWRKGGKTVDRPTQADTLYKAGEELVARSLRLEPDVVFVVSAMFLHPDVVVLLKRAGIKVAMLLTESPYDDERQRRLLPFCDVVWTNERLSAKQLQVGYLPHAFTPEVHQAEPTKVVPLHEVVFVGTGFEERIDLLSAVDWTGIDFGLYGGWGMLGSRHHLRKHLRDDYITNAHATALYKSAKIGLNLHRRSMGFGKGAPKIDDAESLNPRAYELAAAGCFMVSDRRAEVGEVFGDLVPTFSTADELRSLLDRWLADDFGRSIITAQLPFAVSSHTWHARAQQVTQDLLHAGIGARREADTDARLARVAGG